MTDDMEQLMLKLCPHYGPSPARDQWIAGFEAAVAALAAPAQHEARQRCIDARNALNAALHGDGAVIDTLEQAVASACAVIKRHAALAAPAQPDTWREAVLDALTATGSDMPATATPAEIVRAVIDANVQIALDPRVSDAAPARSPRRFASGCSRA